MSAAPVARLSEGEINRRIARLMEPEPAPVSARELRATYREWLWVSWHMHRSPGGWWEAQIGTEHGPPEDDDKPVRWRPVDSELPTVEWDATWRVIERLQPRFWFKIIVGVAHGTGRGVVDPEPTVDIEVGTYPDGKRSSRSLALLTVPLAETARGVCEAALIALEKLEAAP